MNGQPVAIEGGGSSREALLPRCFKATTPTERGRQARLQPRKTLSLSLTREKTSDREGGGKERNDLLTFRELLFGNSEKGSARIYKI